MVVRTKASGLRTDAILAWYCRLILNFWWSDILFRFKKGGFALGEMAFCGSYCVYDLYFPKG